MQAWMLDVGRVLLFCHDPIMTMIQMLILFPLFLPYAYPLCPLVPLFHTWTYPSSIP